MGTRIGKASDDPIQRYKAHCRNQFSRVGFLATDEVPRNTCWLSRSARDLESIENDKCEPKDRMANGHIDDQKPRHLIKLSDDSLLRDILNRKRQRIFITGEGGSGKTEFARYLAWELSDPSSPVAPLLFELKGWKDAGDIYKLAAGCNADALEPLACQGRVVFILDGLDELRFAFVDFSRNVQQLMIRFPDCTFIFAGRPGSLGDLHKHGFPKHTQYLLEPLYPADIDRYIRGYFDAIGAPDRGRELIEIIRSSGHIIRQLLSQPFMLAMTCSIQRCKETKIRNLLNDPARLVENGLRDIFARRRENDCGSPTGRLKLDDDVCLASLSALAAHSFSTQYEIDREAAIRVIRQHADAPSRGEAESRLVELAPDCGIFIRTTGRNYGFTNRLVAEFLAARWIASHGYPGKVSVGALESGEDRIDESVLEFMSDYIWSIRHRDLNQALRFEIGRCKPALLARFIQWLVASLRQRFAGRADDLDLKRTLFAQLCRSIHAYRNPSIPLTLQVQLQADLHYFIPPNGDWYEDNLLVYYISLLPSPLRSPYIENLILRLRACNNADEEQDMMGSLAGALASGFADSSEVGQALLDTLRACKDPQMNKGAIRVLAEALASGFANNLTAGKGLLETLRICNDPVKHRYTISVIAHTLASSFANDPDVAKGLLEAMWACNDPQKHGDAIHGLAEALGAGFANNPQVGKALLKALRACNDPQKHGDAIRGLAEALGTGFANYPGVNKALLKALRACNDPQKHWDAIFGLARGLGNGFANNHKVSKALLRALRACKDPKRHGHAIFGLAQALASGFANNPRVGKALLKALRACSDPKDHGDAIHGVALALGRGFANNPDVGKALLEALRACNDPTRHRYAIYGLAEALASGFANSPDIGEALLETLRACSDPDRHMYLIEHIARALESGFANYPNAAKGLIERLRSCNDRQWHSCSIGKIAAALARSFANNSGVRMALLEALWACNDPIEHRYTIKSLAFALAFGFAGDSEIARALCKKECAIPLGNAEWNEFVVLKGPHRWLTSWAGEHGEKWGLADDPAFAIRSLDDERPPGVSDEAWTDRHAVLVAPRERIRNGLDPSLLPVEYIHDSDDLGTLVELLNGENSKRSKAMARILAALRAMPKKANGLLGKVTQEDLYDDLIEMCPDLDTGGRARGDAGLKNLGMRLGYFEKLKNLLINHTGLGPKTRRGLLALFNSLGHDLRGYDPDRFPARDEPPASVEREKMRDFQRHDVENNARGIHRRHR